MSKEYGYNHVTASRNHRRSPFQNISLELQQAGLWCFPIWLKPVFKPGEIPKKFDKIPLVKWKPFQDRPPTAAEFASWCAKFPWASAAGLPTGPGTGVLIIDADNADAIEWLELRGMPETPTVRSRRGLHYYFAYPSEIEIHNSTGAIAPGVDVRGIGGMAATAGSEYQFIDDTEPGVNKPTTFIYSYAPDHSLADLPLATPPGWLLDWLRSEADQRGATAPTAPPQPYRGKVHAWAHKAYTANIELLRCAVPGTRNNACWNVARRLGQLCAGGELDSVEVMASLHAVAVAWPNSSHTLDTINHAFKAGEAHPRSAPQRRAHPCLTFDTDAALGSEVITFYDEPFCEPAAQA